jgi:hypothetical protein
MLARGTDDGRVTDDVGTNPRRRNPLVALLPMLGIGMGIWVLVAVSRYPWNDISAAYAELLGWATLLGSGVLTLAALRTTRVAVRVLVSLLSVVAVCVGALGLTLVQESETGAVPVQGLGVLMPWSHPRSEQALPRARSGRHRRPSCPWLTTTAPCANSRSR